MKNLGYEIGCDGITQWRNNGGIIERRALYANQKDYESVAVPSNFNLQEFCKEGGYKFTKTLKEARNGITINKRR